MKKRILLTLATILISSLGYADTASNTTTRDNGTQKKVERHDHENANSSVYDNIRYGWNKFIDFLGAKKTN
jgi:hypothetical protein